MQAESLSLPRRKGGMELWIGHLAMVLPSMNEMLDWRRTMARGSRRKSANDLYTIRKAQAQDAVALALASLRAPRMASAHFGFTWVESNKRKDPDNILSRKKFLLDAFVAAGLLPNDGWQQVLSISESWTVANSDENIGVHIFAYFIPAPVSPVSTRRGARPE
jgi:hypothetical protein